MKHVFLMVLFALVGHIASADTTLYPGETRWIAGGQYVTCSNGTNPPPGPRYVHVYPDHACLMGIGATDGKSMAQRAYNCDKNNLFNYGVTSSCTLTQRNVDRPLFDAVYAKRTSILYPDQITTVEDACAWKTYSCP